MYDKGFRIQNIGMNVSCFGYPIFVFGSRVSGLGSRVSEVRVSYFHISGVWSTFRVCGSYFGCVVHVSSTCFILRVCGPHSGCGVRISVVWGFREYEQQAPIRSFDLKAKAKIWPSK